MSTIYRIFAIGSVFVVGCANVIQAKTTVFTEETGIIRHQPGQGWTTMGANWDKLDEVVNLGGIYDRPGWSTLEPQEGVYDWRKLDFLLSLAKKHRVPLSFRIMCACSNSHDGYVTPKWVFDKGAKDDTYTVWQKNRKGKVEATVQHTPQFDDPIFMESHFRFLKALAERYDGNPWIAGLDLGSYGHWGEWHCHGLPPCTNRYVAPGCKPGKYVPAKVYPLEIRKQYVDAYLNNFKKSTIVFMSDDAECLKYAIGDGEGSRVGFRRDGCGNPWHFTQWIGTGKYKDVTKMADVWKYKPIWLESYGSGASLKKNNNNLDFTFNWMLTNHVTILNTCPFTPLELKDDVESREYMKRIDLYAGARFVPLKARVEEIDGKTAVGIAFVNRGVARLHLPYEAVWEMRDQSGKVLASRVSASDPQTWMPGNFKFRDDLPFTLKPGTSLYLRLRHIPGCFRDFKFAAKEIDADGALHVSSN